MHSDLGSALFCPMIPRGFKFSFLLLRRKHILNGTSITVRASVCARARACVVKRGQVEASKIKAVGKKMCLDTIWCVCV